MEKLYFWQPRIGLSVRLPLESNRRGLTLRASENCRALLNRLIYQWLCVKLTGPGKKQPGKPDWEPAPQVRKEVPVWEPRAIPATLTIAINSIRTYEMRKNLYGYGNTKRPVSGPIPASRIRDFYYLADLLCGTFGTLWSPYARPKRLALHVNATGPHGSTLGYRGVDSTILIHPAAVALFFGQLRLAAFLAAAGVTPEIRKEIPTARVKQALLNSNRETCIRLLEKARPWILRSETGLWAFRKEHEQRYDQLLEYFAAGGTGFDLTGKDMIKNWDLLNRNPYPDFHDRGFNDYMARKGKTALLAGPPEEEA